MILFRAVTNEELLNMLHQNNKSTHYTRYGENTFKYENGNEYLHFFKYAEHAFYYKDEINGVAVLECIIPDDIIVQHGFGFYGGVTTYKNKSLYGYYIPLPECIIKKEDFELDYIYDISDQLYNRHVSKKLNNNDNEKYNVPIEEKLSLFNEKDGYDYRSFSYSEIYYEIVYKLLLECNFSGYEVVKVLSDMDLNKEILSYFDNNKELLLEVVKENDSKISSFKQKILNLFNK